MSTIGFVKFKPSLWFPDDPNKPAATEESFFDRTQVNRTGMTPSTRVRSSLAYLLSSVVNSCIRSAIVAVAKRLRFVRMLLADLILFFPVWGRDKTDIKSAWVVRRRFSAAVVVVWGRCGSYVSCLIDES